MNCIFVAWDGSDCAHRALNYAIALARRQTGCTIHVAHAHEPVELYGEVAVYAARGKIEQFQREQSQAVLAEAQALLQDAGVPFRTEELVGAPASTLATRAGELACCCIVMGTHGRGALASLVMGSVATKVIHFSHVPVTLVK